MRKEIFVSIVAVIFTFTSILGYVLSTLYRQECPEDGTEYDTYLFRWYRVCDEITVIDGVSYPELLKIVWKASLFLFIIFVIVMSIIEILSPEREGLLRIFVMSFGMVTLFITIFGSLAMVEDQTSTCTCVCT
jgi:hypothetical protein